MIASMPVIGLTGGIGMGKTTVAQMLKREGFPVHSADKAVHKLLGPGGKAVPIVASRFKGVLRKDAIDRKLLAALVFADSRKLKELEKLLHPFVQKEERDFLEQAKRKSAALAVLEIPLLFETGAEKRCDFVITVSAPLALQQSRVMRRRGMTAQKLRAILERQMKDEERCKRADFVISTSRSLKATEKELKQALGIILRS